MAHKEQMEFCLKIKKQIPSYFRKKLVLDVGSLDVNGNNQYLFDECLYLGVDIAEGRNVDLISFGSELKLPDNTFDTIISTECFEHDRYYPETLKNIYRMLKPGGLFLFTCATTGRPEHGTRKTRPCDAPLLESFGDWQDYYKNLTESDIKNILAVDELFSEYAFEVNNISHDLYFFGIKVGELPNRSDYSFIIRNNIWGLELKQAQDELKQAQDELKQAQDGLRTCKSELTLNLKEVETMRKQLEDRESTLLMWKTQYETIFHSKSWRLTAPLREIAKWFK